jgi:hypothetical protein
MFKAKRPVVGGLWVWLTRGPARFDILLARERSRRAALPKAAALLAVLSASALGCALEPREGDGLNADFREVTINPSTTGSAQVRRDAGPVMCAQGGLFAQVVLPLLTSKHEGTGPADMPPPGPQACSECHDGTKQKALVAMFIEPTLSDVSCAVALARELKEHDILSSSNPGRPDVVHDFKFKNVEDYNRFRDGVVMWLTAEGVTPTQ